MENVNETKVNLITTVNILDKYVSHILKEYDLKAVFVAMDMETTFGKEIHKQIDGFIQYALGNNEFEHRLSTHEIKTTLIHDLVGGIKKDKLMLPRVSGYDKYSK